MPVGRLTLDEHTSCDGAAERILEQGARAVKSLPPFRKSLSYIDIGERHPENISTKKRFRQQNKCLLTTRCRG